MRATKRVVIVTALVAALVSTSATSALAGPTESWKYWLCANVGACL